MSSLSNPLESLSMITSSRPRDDTTTLLPPSYDPDSNEIIVAPEPEDILCDYTTERLQQGLAYAQKVLSRRHISPRTETFMIIYEEVLKDALNADTQGKRAEHASAIRIAEKLIQRKGFLKYPTSPDQAELQDHLLRLRELQYYLRYGDYVKIVPARLRIQPSQTKTENWQLLSGRHYWATIADRLEDEDKQRIDARAKGRNLDGISLDAHIAVRRACTELGVSEELAMRSILEYATRNTQAHRDLTELREKGKFHLLAETLWTDREDLDAIFSEFKLETDKSSLRRRIQTEIDAWFDTSVDSSNPDVWGPREALTKCYIEARRKSRRPSEEEEIKEADLAHDQKRGEERAARQKAASMVGSSVVSIKES